MIVGAGLVPARRYSPDSSCVLLRRGPRTCPAPTELQPAGFTLRQGAVRRLGKLAQQKGRGERAKKLFEKACNLNYAKGCQAAIQD